MKKLAKKRVRRSKASSVEQILEQALKLLSEEGWSSLDLKSLAGRCGMSPSNVIYHFKNREGLLASLLKYVSENNWKIVSEAQRPDFDAFRRLTVHFEKNLEWAKKFPEQAHVVTQIYSQAAFQAEFAKIFQVMVEKAQGRINEYLLSGQREGIFHFILPSTAMAKFLHNVLVGAFINITATVMTGQMKYTGSEWQTIIKSMVQYKA